MFVRMEPHVPLVHPVSPASVWPVTQALDVSTIRTNVLRVRVCTDPASTDSMVTAACALRAMLASVPR